MAAVRILHAGVMMTAVELLKQNPNPTEGDPGRIEGVICRCTGYQNIVRACRYAAARLAEEEGRRRAAGSDGTEGDADDAERVGSPLERRRSRLITGQGNFTDDIQLPGMVHMAVLRSPYAHARIKRIDVSEARRAPGVVAVYTGKDLEGKMGTIPTSCRLPDANIQTPPHHALAVDKVRYVGDGVALVVAEDRYAARDALERIEVEYEELPAVVDQEAAMREGAPQLHEDVPGNIAFHWKAGEVPDEVFEQAEVVIRRRFRQQRLIPNPMEPRAAVAKYNPSTGEMTLWCTSQNPHIHRFILSASWDSRIEAAGGARCGGGFGCRFRLSRRGPGRVCGPGSAPSGQVDG